MNKKEILNVQIKDFVKIPLKRYDELLKAETKIELLEKLISKNNQYFSKEDIKWIFDLKSEG